MRELMIYREKKQSENGKKSQRNESIFQFRVENNEDLTSEEDSTLNLLQLKMSLM